MSEQEKQAAIAKLQAQGCRRWMTLLIIAPVFICAILTLIAPMIQNNLARREANELCQSLPQQFEAVHQDTIWQIDGFTGEALITVDTIGQMVLFGETTLETPVTRRDNFPAILHPDGNYSIYAEYRPSYSTRFFICDNNEALGAFTADETAGDMAFNPDGTVFAISEGRQGQIRIFDAVAIEEIRKIDIHGTASGYRHIDSLAFHPTEPLLFFTSEDELFVYETANFTELLWQPIFETQAHEIGFNADGSLFFMSSHLTDATTYVWGVRDN